MLFGVQYERMPNPRPEDWDQDFQNMAKKGLTLARTWLYWRVVNPAPDVWDFSHYDRLFETARKHGIKIQIQLFIEAVPEYLSKLHPQWHYQNKDGKFQSLHAFQAQQIGGNPGFDYANPDPKAMAEEYIRRVAERYKDHPAFWGYDIWNETWLSTWLDSAWCQRYRKDFLQEKYDTIQELNKAYVSQYRSFSEVLDQRGDDKRPVGNVYLPNMDAEAFHIYMTAKMCQWRADTVRAYDPGHPVTSHYFIYSHSGLSDPWAVHKSLDGWGISLHVGTIGGYLLPVCMTRCMTQAAGSEMPWWMAENGSGSIWNGLNTNRKSVHFLISSMVMGAMLETAGVVFWQYRPEIKDAESPSFGLVKLNGEDSERSLAVSRFIAMYRCHEELFMKAVAAPSPVGLVYSPDAYRMNNVVESSLYEDFEGWHTALCQNGCIPDILRDTDLLAGIPGHVRLLVLPMEVIELPGLRNILTTWVESGGTLVAAGQTFINDHLLYAQREYPGKDLFGVNEDETDEYTGDVSCFGQEIGWNTLPSGGRRIDCILYGARPVGSIGKRPIITVFNKGRGKTIWFGCTPGRTHDYTKSDGLYTVVMALLADAQIKPTVKATQGIVAHTLKNGSQRLTFVLNLTNCAVCTWLTLDDEIVMHVDELISGQVVYDGIPTSSFPLSLDAEQSCILTW